MRLVVLDEAGKGILVAQALGVDGLDAADPVALGDPPMPLDVVLAAGEVPQEVAPVHPVHLVLEEEPQVLAHGGLVDDRGLALAVRGPYRGALEVAPLLVFGLVLRLRTVHPREQHGELRIVHRLGTLAVVGDLVDVVHRVPRVVRQEVVHAPAVIEALHGTTVLLDQEGGGVDRIPVLPLAAQRRAPELAGRQGPVPVLFAVQVAQQVEDVLRVVLVDRWVGAAAYHDHGVRGVADHDHGDAEQDGIEHHLPLALGPAQAQDDERGDQRPVEEHPGVERQPEGVHEQALEEPGRLHQARDDDALDRTQDHRGHHQRGQDPVAGDLELAEVIDERDGGDAEQVQQVHPDAQAHQVGDQDQPACVVGLVGHALPLQDGPEHDGREEGGQGVHLALHGAEPEAVAPGVGQGAHHAAPDHGQALPEGQLRSVPRGHLVGHVRDAPEQEQDGEGAGQCTEHVDGHRYVLRRYEGAEHPSQDHEQGCSGRVAHLQLVGGGDELPAIPEARRVLDRGDVGPGGHQEHDPAGDEVELLMVHAQGGWRAGWPGAWRKYQSTRGGHGGGNVRSC